MKHLIAISLLALTLTACANARDTRMAHGAVIGGAGGALVGGIASGTAGGAVVGGVIGAAGGALIADATRPRYYSRVRCYYSEYHGRRICRRRY
jgi:hypothetical protein